MAVKTYIVELKFNPIQERPLVVRADELDHAVKSLIEKAEKAIEVSVQIGGAAEGPGIGPTHRRMERSVSDDIADAGEIVGPELRRAKQLAPVLNTRTTAPNWWFGYNKVTEKFVMNYVGEVDLVSATAFKTKSAAKGGYHEVVALPVFISDTAYRQKADFFLAEYDGSRYCGIGGGTCNDLENAHRFDTLQSAEEYGTALFGYIGWDMKHEEQE